MCETDSGKLLYNTGSSVWCSVMTRGVGWGRKREAQEGGDICILIADSHYCMEETNMAL